MGNISVSPAQKTLLFIPDISGYTNFVKSTDIEHSGHIVEELLEVLIDANEIGLKVSEIEGDAILFYREAPAPTAAEVLQQVQRMFVHFHSHLKKYESQRICQCGACSTAQNLSLKFFVHFGDVATKHVKNRPTLFGEDVIIAHRLMKNTIDSNEYALFTNSAVQACANWSDMAEEAWVQPVHSEEAYDVGTIPICYLPLNSLLAQVPEPEPTDYSAPGITEKFIEAGQLIEAPLEVVFNVISDLSFRHNWMAGLNGSDQLNHKVTQAGSTHRCLLNGIGGNPSFVSHDFQVEKDRLTFVESDSKDGLSSVFVLRRAANGKTEVEVNSYFKPNLLKRLLFKFLFRKKALEAQVQSFSNLNNYCKQLVKEGQLHPNRIELAQAE